MTASSPSSVKASFRESAEAWETAFCTFSMSLVTADISLPVEFLLKNASDCSMIEE